MLSYQTIPIFVYYKSSLTVFSKSIEKDQCSLPGPALYCNCCLFEMFSCFSLLCFDGLLIFSAHAANIPVHCGINIDCDSFPHWQRQYFVFCDRDTVCLPLLITLGQAILKAWQFPFNSRLFKGCRLYDGTLQCYKTARLSYFLTIA